VRWGVVAPRVCVLGPPPPPPPPRLCHGLSLQAAVLSDGELLGLWLECDREGWGVEKRHAPERNVYRLVENRREIVELQYGDVEMEVTGEARDVFQRRIRRGEH